MARAVGVPGAYDYGPERVAWLGHLVTNWMGDAGFLRRLNVRVLRHNLIGDATWCRGAVTGKEAGGVVHLVAAGRQPARRNDRPRGRRRWSCRSGRPVLEMPSLLEIRSYPEVLRAFDWHAPWELFDGDRDRLNLAHECVDRHVGAGHGAAHQVRRRPARRRTAFASSRRGPSRFAQPPRRGAGVERGRSGRDHARARRCPSTARSSARSSAARSPCRSSRCSGPTASRPGVEDCRPTLLLVEREAAAVARHLPRPRRARRGRRGRARSPTSRERYEPDTAAADLAVFQYTSGTTRARPAAVRHTHRSVVTLMVGRPLRRRARAGRPLLLSVVARVGTRPLARHDRAAGPRDPGRRLRRQVSGRRA